jgi:hypothetical protein
VIRDEGDVSDAGDAGKESEGDDDNGKGMVKPV